MGKQKSKKTPQKLSEKTKTAKQNNLPVAVVGIGASAGGLEATSQLLKNLPNNIRMAFVIIQHLDPNHKSSMPEILDRVTSLPVKQIINNVQIQPNNVYTIPPNKHVQIKNGKLILSERIKTDGMHMPIDYFFRSLALDQKNKAIGIILSGTASDGTVGIKSIKAEGGLTFAQDELSAKYPGMPHSAVESGNIDIVLSPEKIAKELIRIGKHPYIALNSEPVETEKAKESSEDIEEPNEDSLTKLYNALRASTGVDFSLYKVSTVKRRISRRMAINKFRKFEDYVNFVKEDKNEIMNLYHDLLINVTTFFRDPEAFESLKTKVFPKIIKNSGEDNSIRIWVPGCATGEEAYSIAIFFLEFLDKKAVDYNIQIFATDISEPSIDRARAGIYAESIIKDIPFELQKKYFVKINGRYQISKTLRDLCIFARQDISRDPPFSRIDLISCRNLLIYLSADLQKKIIPIFHYALKPKGFLMLGTSENVGNFGELFNPIDKKNRLFERKDYQRRIDQNFSFANAEVAKSKGKKYDHFPDELNLLKEADKLILSKYAPAAVLINHNLEIIQFRGKIKNYLDPVPGDASLNIFKMIKEGLNAELHTLIRKASTTKKPVVLENIAIDINGTGRHVDLEVVPLRSTNEFTDLSYLILFKEIKTDKTVIPKKRAIEDKPASSGKSDELIKKLKEELSITKEHLQSILEQQEASNEELRSALEELQSSNEELQSTNEEMETAREELQSTNEELMTVNYELESRNKDLDEANNDLNNILSGINTPVILLGRDLKIKRFTQKAEALWNLIPSDIGRPFGHLKPNFEVRDLKKNILDVMDDLESKEIEIQDNENIFYSMKIRPYKTFESKIEGVIISMHNIDAIKKKAAIETEAKNYLEAVLNTIREPLLILNKNLEVDSANRAFYETFRVTEEDTLGKFIYELGKSQWNIRPLKTLLEDILPKDNVFENYIVEHKFPKIGFKKMSLNARRIDSAPGKDDLILLAFVEVKD